MSVGHTALPEGGQAAVPPLPGGEFACQDGADLVKIDTDLVELLERIRTAACGAVTVNSGYRTASTIRRWVVPEPASTRWAGRRIFR